MNATTPRDRRRRAPRVLRRSAVGSGAGDGQRAQRASVGDLRARPGYGRASTLGRSRSAVTPRSTTPAPVTGTRRLLFGRERRHRLLLDDLDRQLVREVGLARAAPRPTSTAGRVASTSSRTLSVVICSAASCERGADAVALGGGDAGDLRRRGPRRSSSRAATPSRRRRARPAPRAPGRSAARGCGSSPPLPRCFDGPSARMSLLARSGARPTLSTSPAPIVRSRSPSRNSARRKRLGGRVVAHPGDALAVAGVGGRLGHEQAGDAGVVLGGLARGIDVEDHGQVGARPAPCRTPSPRAGCGCTGAAGSRRRRAAGSGCGRRRSSPRPRSGGARSRRRRAAP